MKKKVLAILCGCLFITSILAGCSAETKGDNAAAPQSSVVLMLPHCVQQ
jgi:hypothetical protein